MAAALLAVAALPAAATAQPAPAAAMDGQWHFVAAPYLWFTGINGDVTVASALVVPIDMSFSDIWENFDLGLQGHFEARKDRVGFGADVIWVNLDAPLAAAGPVEAIVDVRQLVTEGFGFYRVLAGGPERNPAHLDVMVGVRYSGMRTRLKVEGVSNGSDSDFQDKSWVDLMGGVRFRAPLGSRFGILGRADIAGPGSNRPGTWKVTSCSGPRTIGASAWAGATWTLTTTTATSGRARWSTSPTTVRASGSATAGEAPGPRGPGGRRGRPRLDAS
jgi:hypothetical protein